MALTTEQRNKIPADKFYGPHDSFPIINLSTARAALRLAPYSEEKGNLTKPQEAHIENVAHKKLEEGK